MTNLDTIERSSGWQVASRKKWEIWKRDCLVWNSNVIFQLKILSIARASVTAYFVWEEENHKLTFPTKSQTNIQDLPFHITIKDCGRLVIRHTLHFSDQFSVSVSTQCTQCMVWVILVSCNKSNFFYISWSRPGFHVHFLLELQNCP